LIISNIDLHIPCTPAISSNCSENACAAGSTASPVYLHPTGLEPRFSTHTTLMLSIFSLHLSVENGKAFQQSGKPGFGLLGQ
jgi:hypothetical protein